MRAKEMLKPMQATRSTFRSTVRRPVANADPDASAHVRDRARPRTGMATRSTCFPTEYSLTSATPKPSETSRVAIVALVVWCPTIGTTPASANKRAHCWPKGSGESWGHVDQHLSRQMGGTDAWPVGERMLREFAVYLSQFSQSVHRWRGPRALYLSRPRRLGNRAIAPDCSHNGQCDEHRAGSAHLRSSPDGEGRFEL